MVEFEVDMAYLLEEGELDRVVLHDENGEHPSMLFEPSRGTCRVEYTHRYDYEGGYGGTEYEHGLTCGHRVTWGSDDAPDFCPHCGAKVVQR